MRRKEEGEHCGTRVIAGNQGSKSGLVRRNGVIKWSARLTVGPSGELGVDDEPGGPVRRGGYVRGRLCMRWKLTCFSLIHGTDRRATGTRTRSSGTICRASHKLRCGGSGGFECQSSLCCQRFSDAGD